MCLRDARSSGISLLSWKVTLILTPFRSFDVQNGATWRSRTVSMQPALPIVHVNGRLVGRSIVLSPLVGPLRWLSRAPQIHQRFAATDRRGPNTSRGLRDLGTQTHDGDTPLPSFDSLRPGKSSEPTLTAALRSSAKRTRRPVVKFSSCALKKGAVAMRGHHG